MRKLLIFISMCLTISFVSAQVDLNIVLEDEDLSEESKQELLEQLEDIDKNIGDSSLNLNTLTKEQMILLGLNNFQIFSLQNYIKNSGQILSLNELHFINGFDEQTIQRISPFVYAERVIERHLLTWIPYSSIQKTLFVFNIRKVCTNLLATQERMIKVI